MRVAVVGAGIVGGSVARSLATSGAEVTVFDMDRPGAGTSSTTFAWVNSHEKKPPSYHRLNVAGVAEHRSLAETAANTQQWLFRTGHLQWADDAALERTLTDRVTRLQESGYPCSWLDPADVTRIEPDVVIPDHVRQVAYFPEEGYVLPSLLLARLLGEARDAGAVVECPAKVVAIEPGTNGADLRFADGHRRHFDVVVCCAGRWTQQLADTTGTHIPLADPDVVGGAAVGFLAYTAATPARLSRVLTTPQVNIRPDGAGRFVLQGLDLDHDADPAAVPGGNSIIADTLASRARSVLRMAADPIVERVSVGQRALPVDGLTVAGFGTGDAANCYFIATHSGVTLGPLLGRLASEEIVHDQRSPLLKDFRVDRFSAHASLTVPPARLPGQQ